NLSFRGGRTMSTPGSVTSWLVRLKEGDADAAQPLWERYFRRMVDLARKRLRDARGGGGAGGDVGRRAFPTFRRGAPQGPFPGPADRDDLWQLLVVITARKAMDLVVRQRRLCRGGGRVRGESALLDPAASGNGGIEQVVGSEPTPEFAAQVAEEC